MDRTVDSYRYVFVPQSVADTGEGWVYFAEVGRIGGAKEARARAVDFANECEEEIEAFCLATSIVGSVSPSYDDEESWGDSMRDERLDR